MTIVNKFLRDTQTTSQSPVVVDASATGEMKIGVRTTRALDEGFIIPFLSKGTRICSHPSDQSMHARLCFTDGYMALLQDVPECSFKFDLYGRFTPNPGLINAPLSHNKTPLPKKYFAMMGDTLMLRREFYQTTNTDVIFWKNTEGEPCAGARTNRALPSGAELLMSRDHGNEPAEPIPNQPKRHYGYRKWWAPVQANWWLSALDIGHFKVRRVLVFAIDTIRRDIVANEECHSAFIPFMLATWEERYPGVPFYEMESNLELWNALQMLMDELKAYLDDNWRDIYPSGQRAVVHPVLHWKYWEDMRLLRTHYETLEKPERMFVSRVLGRVTEETLMVEDPYGYDSNDV